jgi:hypothetical protein
MKFKELFAKWGLSRVSLNLKFAELEFSPNESDEIAAWEMYVELITRITTQELLDDSGIESSALESVFRMFEITRNILKSHGRTCNEFTKIAVIVLNQVIRPFTAKWHKRNAEGLLSSSDEKHCFRGELKVLQGDLRNYSRMLAEIAKVEDLTYITSIEEGDI